MPYLGHARLKTRLVQDSRRTDSAEVQRRCVRLNTDFGGVVIEELILYEIYLLKEVKRSAVIKKDKPDTVWVRM